MKKAIIIPAITILCAIGLLFGLTFGLQDFANTRARVEHQNIMATLLPGSQDFILEPYTGKDANIRSIHKAAGYGYVIETVTSGYAGEIRMLIGVSEDGKVTGLVVREMNETSSLGQNALNDTDFLGQFLNVDSKVQIGADGVDAITGATVTSKAVVRCVNSAVAYVNAVNSGSQGDTDPDVDADSGATSWGG